MLSQVRALLAEFFYEIKHIYAALAQQVERIHGKDEVAGSSPASGLDEDIIEM